MNRFLRPQCPGGIFHITARTQGHAPWFRDELKPHIAQIIVDGICSSGCYLMAYAVMDNHFHIVLAQNTRTLGWTMKPIMRRIALLVQRHHDITGHVFERRFRSKQCVDAEHARNALLYTHHNPVEAGICVAVGDYEWTSHSEFLERRSTKSILVEEVIQLFSPDLKISKANPGAARANYVRYIEWWCRKKEAERAEKDFNEAPPPARGGDDYFKERYATPALPLLRPTEDLRDAAWRSLALIDPQMSMEVMRRSYGGREAVRVRKELMAALLSKGFRGNAIADYLRVDPAVVSRVNRVMRWQPTGRE